MPIVSVADEKKAGSSSEVTAAGVAAPTIWISVQTPQCSSTRRGLGGEVGPSGSATAAFAASWADAAEATRRCKCPNVSASWSAIATSANHAPDFTFERNQRILRQILGLGAYKTTPN